MRILGIDPGLNTTGYGIIDIIGRDPVLVEGGIIRTDPVGDPLEAKLSRLFDGITDVLDQFRPGTLALEELYSHYEHPATAILMGHARGVICLSAAQRGVPVCSYGATQIKSCLTGNGRASKEQIQRAIQARLKLKEIPKPPDVADALAAAICHYWTVTSPVMAAVGDHQRIAHVRRAKR